MSSAENAEGPKLTAVGDPPSNLHLWKLPRGRHGLSRELVLQSQRERLLAGVVRVTAAKGYQASSVADILKEAGVGRETFYKHFKDKEDCFVTVNDALVADLEAVVKAAYEQPGSWPQRVRLGLAATLKWFADSPEITRVMMIEMGTVGPIASARFRETFSRFTALLDDGRGLVENAPDLPNLSSIAGGAVIAPR
jgi:AcrR family transcriptional regulator